MDANKRGDIETELEKALCVLKFCINTLYQENADDKQSVPFILEGVFDKVTLVQKYISIGS